MTIIFFFRLEVGEHLERTNSITPIRSHSESVMESLPARPLSAPTGHIHHVIRSIAPPTHLSEEITYQNTLPACNFQHHNGKGFDLFIRSRINCTFSYMMLTTLFSGDSLNSLQCSSRLSNTERQEGDYDILPKRKSMIINKL